MTTNKDMIHDILMNAAYEIKEKHLCSKSEFHYLLQDLNEAEDTIEEVEKITEFTFMKEHVVMS